MPYRPNTPCKHPGCGVLVPYGVGYCKAHAPLHAERRPDSNARGYGRKWQTASKAYLHKHPICAVCGRPAEVVDHIVPHKGDMRLFWDRSNWQSLCKRCHDIKTDKEDGGFGRGKVYTFANTR